MSLSRQHAIALAAWALSAGAVTAPAQDAVHAPPELIAPREYLALFDVDAQALSVFDDAGPLDAAQRRQILTILFRLRRYPPAAVEHYSRPAAAVATIAEHPAEARGELYTLAGRVTRVERQELDAQDREQFELEAYYRCTFETSSGEPAVICALDVPAAWKLDEAIDERAGGRAMFLKLLPSGPAGDDAARAGGPRLLFVTERMAWHPETLLGRLGMDVGLLDGVRDRTALNERECFYQMLAAVRRADEAELRRAARQQFADMRPPWRKDVADENLSREQRAAARRALERAKEGASDIVPLFNEPAAVRGALVTLRGDALRALEVRVDDPDVVRRFGIRHYYEVEIVTSDSQNNPVVCCVARLPEGMPLGDNIRAEVRVTGFFMKSWAYRVGQADGQGGRIQMAPLVIAGTLSWIPAAAPGGQNVTLAVVLVAALLGAVVVMWYVRRSDRRALVAAERARSQLPEQISFEPPEIDA